MPEFKKKKALIVSFFFSPENNIASVRISKFAKYLPEFGWEPVVLTAGRIDGTPRTLPVEIDEAKISRTPYFTLSHAISKRLSRPGKTSTAVPSPQTKPAGSGWNGSALKALRLMKPVYSLPLISEIALEPMDWQRSAVAKGLELIGKGDIDIIFSSSGPSVCHLIASRLNKKTGIPWVADFRDLWSANPYSSKAEPFHFFQRQWEKKTMKNSAFLTTVSDPLAAELTRLHGKPVVTIPNGFDESDYEGTNPLLPKFTITYTGSIYPGKQDPSLLFQAIAELRDEGKISLTGLEVRFFGGNLSAYVSALVKKYGVEQFVKVYGLVAFKDSIAKQKESTALLLLTWTDTQEKGIITGKVFEYLGASRPVLAVGPKGSVIDELLSKTGGGVVASEVQEIKTLLVKWIEEFNEDGKITFCYQPDKVVVNLYSRKEQTRKLAVAFDNVLFKNR